MRLLLLIFILAPLVHAQGEAPADGATRSSADGGFEAWDAPAGQWVAPLAFWESYARRRGGLTWGRGSEYPPYAGVKEHDTFLVLVKPGPCLMEFFHGRWRRANDVRRWDPLFNEYGGCAQVFD